MIETVIGPTVVSRELVAKALDILAQARAMDGSEADAIEAKVLPRPDLGEENSSGLLVQHFDAVASEKLAELKAFVRENCPNK